MWYVYGEGGGEFTNLKDARQCAKEFSKQGNEFDGYGEPGEVSIWKDGTLFLTYNNGKVTYDGWTKMNNNNKNNKTTDEIKKIDKQTYYKYRIKDLSTLEEDELTINVKLDLDKAYKLTDGRRIQPLELLNDVVEDEDDTISESKVFNNNNQTTDNIDKMSTLKKYLNGGGQEQLQESFRLSSKLNPNLFDNKTNEMYNDVRVRLCDIADTFVESIQEDEVPLKVYDYWLVGSNAAYNYTPESDIDIHVIVDMEVGVNPYLLRLLYDYIKSGFNDKYDIMVKGHEVELYLEDIKTTAVTNGIYSLKQARWIKVPEKTTDEDIEYNIEDTELYNVVYDKFDRLEDSEAEQFLDDLYILRKESLVSEGEFGEGNLVFKAFRNKGYIDELKDMKYRYKSSQLTMENYNNKSITSR